MMMMMMMIIIMMMVMMMLMMTMMMMTMMMMMMMIPSQRVKEIVLSLLTIIKYLYTLLLNIIDHRDTVRDIDLMDAMMRDVTQVH